MLFRSANRKSKILASRRYPERSEPYLPPLYQIAQLLENECVAPVVTKSNRTKPLICKELRKVISSCVLGAGREPALSFQTAEGGEESALSLNSRGAQMQMPRSLGMTAASGFSGPRDLLLSSGPKTRGTSSLMGSAPVA